MRSLCVLLVLAGPVWAQAPAPQPAPPKPVVIFPSEPIPVPVPPAPSSKIQLPADTLYIVRSTVPCLVLTSPQGIVSVAADAGPVRIMAKIWPSTVNASVKFTEPYLYVVQAQATGLCELIVIPEGTKEAAGITRKLIDAQLAPIPPPEPPGPTPPGPTPPSPAPIPADGFRSVIVFESSELSKLPATQMAALYSQQMRDYLQSHCVMGPDGKTKEFRYWDKDTDVSNDSKLWQDVMKRPRKELPWIILSDGKKGFEGPFPKTEAEAMALIKQYGG